MNNRYKYHRATLRESVSFIGVGLHTGITTRLTLKPSIDARGIYFVRTDLPAGKNQIDARWFNVSDTRLSTNLSNQFKASVNTVEHLMSALVACGIDNVRIEIDGPEVPIMDGSAEAYTRAIQSTGKSYLKAPREGSWIDKPIVVTEGDKYAMLIPHSVPRVTMCIDFPDTVIGSQCYSMTLQDNNYFEEISYARTFGFADQIETLKQQGLAQGGSLINAVLVDGEDVVNPEGLRVKNEFVRHKVLDAIGDLALADAPIIGHYYAYKAGHALNQKLLQKMYSDAFSFSQMPLQEGELKYAEKYIDNSEIDSDEFIEQTLSSIYKKKFSVVG